MSAELTQPNVMTIPGTLNPGWAVSATLPITTNIPSGVPTAASPATSFVTGLAANLIGAFCAQNERSPQVAIPPPIVSDGGELPLRPFQVGTLPTGVVTQNAHSSNNRVIPSHTGEQPLQTQRDYSIPFSLHSGGHTSTVTTNQGRTIPSWETLNNTTNYNI